MSRRLQPCIDSSTEWSGRVCAVLAGWLEEGQGCKDTIVLALGHEVVLCVTDLASCSSLLPQALKQISCLLQSKHTSHLDTGLQGLQVVRRPSDCWIPKVTENPDL